MTILTQPLTLGEPQVAGPLAVFPVLGPEPRLVYRSFAQAVEHGAFVKELDSGAAVGDLLVANPTELPLLVYEGEEVLGAQQNRIFDVSALVAAGGRLSLPVSCVEAGRWDASRFGEWMRVSPQAADPSLRRVKRHTANLRAEQGRAARAEQHEVWHEVGARLARHAVQSPNAALSDVYEGRRHDLDELAVGVHPVARQIGAVACVGASPVALDLVSRPEVFGDLLPRLAQGYALDALDAADRGPQLERAEAFLRQALDAPLTRIATPGLGHGFSFTAAGITGSGLEDGGELVQLSTFPGTGERGRGRPIVRPSERRRR